MARTQELFSIGDVAQLFHLSVSSLRHYETIGLLTPEYTDPRDRLPLLRAAAV